MPERRPQGLFLTEPMTEPTVVRTSLERMTPVRRRRVRAEARARASEVREKIRNGLATVHDHEALREASLVLQALESLDVATRHGHSPSALRAQIGDLSTEIQKLQVTPKKERTAETRRRISELRARKTILVRELTAETSDPGGRVPGQRYTATSVRSVVQGGSPGLGKNR